MDAAGGTIGGVGPLYLGRVVEGESADALLLVLGITAGLMILAVLAKFALRRDDEETEAEEGAVAAPERRRGIGSRRGIAPHALPRPPRAGWAPATVSSVRAEDRDVEQEVDAIVAVLRDQGPMSARRLRLAVDSRLWGPGRFRSALNLARRRGLIRREGGKLTAAVGEG
jgi:hypothetical protein